MKYFSQAILPFINYLVFLVLWPSFIFAGTSTYLTEEFSPELGQKVHVFRLMKNKFEQIDNYDMIMAKIYEDVSNESGSIKSLPRIFEFPDGNRFLVEKTLGEGSLTYVFKVKNLRTNQVSALRMLLDVEGKNLFNNWVKYQPSFIKREYEVPEIYTYLSGQYSEVELLDVKFTLHDLMLNPDKYPKEEVERGLDLYNQYLEKNSKYITFGDDTPENIGFDGKRWMPIDWTSAPETITEAVDRINADEFKVYIHYKNWGSYSHHINKSDFYDKKIRDKVLDIIEKHEWSKFDSVQGKFYSLMPATLHKEDLTKQIEYVKSVIHTDTYEESYQSKLITELLLKVRKSKDIPLILDGIGYKNVLTLDDSDLFHNRWISLFRVGDLNEINEYLKRTTIFYHPKIVKKALTDIFLSSHPKDFIKVFNQIPEELHQQVFPEIYEKVIGKMRKDEVRDIHKKILELDLPTETKNYLSHMNFDRSLENTLKNLDCVLNKLTK